MLKTMDSGVKMCGSDLYPVTYWLTELGKLMCLRIYICKIKMLINNTCPRAIGVMKWTYPCVALE